MERRRETGRATIGVDVFGCPILVVIFESVNISERSDCAVPNGPLPFSVG
jgi:hypothetical protein